MDDSGGSNLEIVIDRILFSARDLKRKLDAVKDNNYRLGGDSSQTDYKSIQRINKLEKENNELKQALEDYQYGLEFIMSKYRSQVVELIQLNKVEKRTTTSETLSLKRNNSVE